MTRDVSDEGLKVRRLLRRCGSGTLATHSVRYTDYPFASFVTYACDHAGYPLFLFSDLSDHTKNLSVNTRVSLLVEAASRRQNPQTGARLSVVGDIRQTTSENDRNRYLARHPGANMYASFADFRFYRMSVESIHWVGGFAQARWFSPEKVLISDKALSREFGFVEDDIISHMNSDHGDALDCYAQAFASRKGTGWQMTGIDPDGFDLSLSGRMARIDFPEPLTTVTQSRAVLVEMAKQARLRRGSR